MHMLWFTSVVLNGRPPAAYLLPLNYDSFTMCFGWVDRCIQGLVSMPTINRQGVTGSLTAARTTFNFHFRFWSKSHIDILPAVGASSLLKKSGQWKSAIWRRMDWKICIHSHSYQHKTRVLNMPGDSSCDEDLQFETALLDKAYGFWRDISSKFRGKNNKS